MRNRIIISTVLIVATVAVFWPVHNYGFLDWDDDLFLYQNRYMTPPTLENTIHFWKEPYKHFYMPITYTAWSALASLSQKFPAEPYGLNPGLFHTANLLVHILSVLVVFSILRLLLTHGFGETKNENDPARPSVAVAAGIGALIFAIHPVQVEPVAWISELKDLLCGLFSFVAIRCYLAYAIASKERNEERKKNVYYLLAFGAFLLGLLSKPAAVIVPLVAFILDRWAIKRPFKDSAAALTGWFAVSGLFTVIGKIAQQSDVYIVQSPIWAKPFIAGDALAFYLYKLVLPLHLGIDYGRTPAYVLDHWWLYVTWILPAALLTGTLFLNKRKTFLVCLAIFAASLLPVLGFIKFIFQNTSTVADHYLYFAMLGAVLAVSLIVRGNKTKQIVPFFAMVIILLAVRSFYQVKTWKDEIDLYTNGLRVNPVSAMMHYNLGTVSFNRGKSEKSIFHYQKVLEIKPDSVDANYRLGYVMAGQGKFTEAIPYYENALRLQPDHLYAHNDLGVIYASQNKLKKSISHLKKSIELRPGNAEVHYNLGVVLKRDGKIDEAVKHFSEALRINPIHPLAGKQLEAVRPNQKNRIPLR